MKKLLSIVVAAFAIFAIAAPASAAGTITAKEQQIIDALSKGVVIDGTSFSFSSDALATAQTVLTERDYTDAQVDSVLADINAAYAYAATQKLPLSQAAKNTLMGYVNSAASTLGLKVTVQGDGFSWAWADGATGGGTASYGNSSKTGANSSGAVKKTGANYQTSLIVFAGLMITACGAVFVGKKYQEA